jgi:hypothetical protein
MNDDPDDQTLLASAYLDGEATPDERALVESTPELLAEVERLRSVAALLADVEPVRISRREEHLATALDAWDRLPEAERTGLNRDRTPGGIVRDGSVLAATPTSLARRRTVTNRRLLGAAAALVLVLAGGVALQVARSGDDTEPLADQVESDAPAAALADDASEAQPATEAASEAADGADAGGQDLGQTEAVPDATRLDTGILDAAPPAERALEQLRSTSDLRDFASAAVDAPAAPRVPAATSAPIDDLLTDEQRAALDAEWPLCLGADVIVGPALYGDVEVLVAIDEGRNLALAYLPATCNEVARVRLP